MSPRTGRALHGGDRTLSELAIGVQRDRAVEKRALTALPESMRHGGVRLMRTTRRCMQPSTNRSDA